MNPLYNVVSLSDTDVMKYVNFTCPCSYVFWVLGHYQNPVSHLNTSPPNPVAQQLEECLHIC